MARDRLTGRRFDALMREYVDRRGGALLAEEELWRDRVPDRADAAAEKTFRRLRACAATGVPLPTPASILPAAGAAAKAVKTVALTLAAAGVIGAAAYTAAPVLRDARGGGIAAVRRAAERKPAEYVIPDPGGDLTVTDEGSSGKMAYRWFGSPEQELIVEIAYAVPEELAGDGQGEITAVGSMWGELWHGEHTELLVLHDGAICITIEYFNADRDELMAYAESLVRANETSN